MNFPILDMPIFHTCRFFFSCSDLFSQNFNCRALLSSIFSTSSMGRPLVSGTQTRTKSKATTEITPNKRNVQEVPIASVKDRKDCATIRFDIQFAVAAIPPQMPRKRSGYISELAIHGTVPIPGEKDKMYRDSPTSANHPKLLGHHLVYHALSSP